MSIVYTATYLYRLSLTFYPLLAGIIYTVALSVYVQYKISLRQHVKGMISAAIWILPPADCYSAAVASHRSQVFFPPFFLVARWAATNLHFIWFKKKKKKKDV